MVLQEKTHTGILHWGHTVAKQFRECQPSAKVEGQGKDNISNTKDIIWLFQTLQFP